MWESSGQPCSTSAGFNEDGQVRISQPFSSELTKTFDIYYVSQGFFFVNKSNISVCVCACNSVHACRRRRRGGELEVGNQVSGCVN